MRTAIRELSDLAATEQLAADLAAVSRPGDVFLLEGELGAGKTTLVRSLADALGLEPRQASSPTFVLMSEYAAARSAEDNRTVPVLLHLDAYRLSDDPEALTLTGWDTARVGEVVTAIEWPSRIAGALEAELDPDRTARLRLTHAGETTRVVELAVPSVWIDRAGIFGLLDPSEDPEPGPTRCPVTGDPVEPSSPHYPFSSERAKLADLHKWFSESYQITRPITQADLEQGE